MQCSSWFSLQGLGTDRHMIDLDHIFFLTVCNCEYANKMLLLSGSVISGIIYLRSTYYLYTNFLLDVTCVLKD
jgi:hypothetical protein